MKNGRKLLRIGAVAGLILLLSACPRPAAPVSNGKLKIVTTLFPLYDFARQVGGDRVEVQLLLPPGVEPHAFDPRPQDILAINHADVFIYIGKEMEPWAADVLTGTGRQDLTVLAAGQGLLAPSEPGHDTREADDHEAELPDHEQAEGKAEHHHHGIDPHVWLDLEKAQKMVQAIARTLARRDPEHQQEYLDRARDYNARLTDLDQRFRIMLKAGPHHTLIYGGHFAFGHFARRYGLSHVSPYAGFSPNAEPTPRAVAELLENMRRHGLKYIFHEPLIEPKVARVIAEETGAKLLLLHPAGNLTRDELSRGETFLSLMEMNYKNLKTGLGGDSP